MKDEISFHNDEGKTVPLIFNVTSGRVNHYAPIIASMIETEKARYVKTYGVEPTSQQLAELSRELTVKATISHNVLGAMETKIPPPKVFLVEKLKH